MNFTLYSPSYYDINYLTLRLTGVEWSTACPCFPLFFRETVVVTCKIEPFLWSLNNLLQKNVIVFFFENQISKWSSFEKKKAIFDLFF